MKKWLLSLITGLFITSSVGAQTMDKENTLYLDTENGRVTIEL